VYNPISDLPDFVLLGLPACESGNPLLVPLAGHELGHTAWRTRSFVEHFGPLVQREIRALVETSEAKYEELFGGDLSDLFVAQSLAAAYSCAMRQIEESFCDFLGLRLFSESYLFAFAYLLTPGAGERSAVYPSMEDRVSALIAASAEYGVVAPDGYESWFTGETPQKLSEKETYLLGLADAARSNLLDELVSKADSVAEAANVPERSKSKIQEIERAFRLLTPASSVGDLTNILNAAWNAFHDESYWSEISLDRIETLNEIVLKSIEILEFESMTE
jgi:hypothetical protein